MKWLDGWGAGESIEERYSDSDEEKRGEGDRRGQDSTEDCGEGRGVAWHWRMIEYRRRWCRENREFYQFKSGLSSIDFTNLSVLIQSPCTTLPTAHMCISPFFLFLHILFIHLIFFILIIHKTSLNLVKMSQLYDRILHLVLECICAFQVILCSILCRCGINPSNSYRGYSDNSVWGSEWTRISVAVKREDRLPNKRVEQMGMCVCNECDGSLSLAAW